MTRIKNMTTGHEYPPVGTIIDDGCLRLVDVLGSGGYGVVYQATDVRGSTHDFYAVKCLVLSHVQRQPLLREITLHRLASSHPGVVNLHRIIEDDDYMYLVMDYAQDQDLFVQILHKARYLGNNPLIKSVFLQLLDAIEHCHSLGIYHRDLKPENVLCFESGFRIALTDFGLATTHCISEEFGTGSAFHMSPECQNGDVDSESVYSPRSCDIWSLGIILLNIVTGRNPWKSAAPEDATFSAYRDDPGHYLLTALPISLELNDILVTMLNVEWRSRPSIPEIRAAVLQVDTFYSGEAIFEGKLARYSGEAGLDLGTGVDKPGLNMCVSGRDGERNFKGQSTRRSRSEDVVTNVPYRLLRLSSPLYKTSPCNLEQFSPIIPTSTNSLKNQLSTPWYPFSSIINGFQSFFHLCSSSNLSSVEKNPIERESKMYVIDI